VISDAGTDKPRSALPLSGCVKQLFNDIASYYCKVKVMKETIKGYNREVDCVSSTSVVMLGAEAYFVFISNVIL
jgi:hypothetical protein